MINPIPYSKSIPLYEVCLGGGTLGSDVTLHLVGVLAIF